MKKLEERYYIARLIADDVMGMLSEEDSLRLKKWREESLMNDMEYENIRQRLYQDLRQDSDLNTEQEWQNFEPRLSCEKRIRYPWYYLTAACAVVGLLIGVMLWHQPEAEQQLPVASGIKSHKAMLILDDGSKVNIGDSTNLTIPVARGIRAISSGNIVKYYANGVNGGGGEVELNTIIVPRGGEYELLLSDGTRVWLNSESRLTYPVRFAGITRQVEMVGEICFDVARNENQPFIVKSGEVSVKVLGTLFNMEAYLEDHKITTTLVRGKVEVVSFGKSRILSPDQQAIVENGEIMIKKVLAQDFMGWTNGFFHFEEASLEEIMAKLARWYNVEFFFTKSSLQNAHFSLDIERYDDIKSILSKIEKTGIVKFRFSERTVIIEE